MTSAQFTGCHWRVLHLFFCDVSAVYGYLLVLESIALVAFVTSARAMYGLLLESIACAVRDRHGDEVWLEISELSGLTMGQTSFSTHTVYDEDVLPNIAQAASDVSTMFDVKLH